MYMLPERGNYVASDRVGQWVAALCTGDKGIYKYGYIAASGAGAAGGMGGGLLPFLNAELQSGIEVILKTLRFEEVVRQADLILTGEGKLDRQTGMGKALDGILRVGEKCQVPVIALGSGRSHRSA